MQPVWRACVRSDRSRRRLWHGGVLVRPLRYQGPEVRWEPKRRRCPECGALVDWRPGSTGQFHLRRHYRVDRIHIEYCVTAWPPYEP